MKLLKKRVREGIDFSEKSNGENKIGGKKIHKSCGEFIFTFLAITETGTTFVI